MTGAQCPRLTAKFDLTGVRGLAERWPFSQIIATKEGKVVELTEWRGVPHPLNCLPVGDHVDVLSFEHLIKEANETVHVVLSEEPPRVEEHAKRSLVAVVVAVEVELHHVVNAILVGRVETTVCH